MINQNDYDYKPHWDIDLDIYCDRLTDSQIDHYVEEINAALTKDGNFAHVERDGDGYLITIWADSDTADIDTLYSLLSELEALGASVENINQDDNDNVVADFDTTTPASVHTPRADEDIHCVKTVFKKAVVYFRADIEYSNDKELQEKIDNFENELCVDLDNLPGGSFDYDFQYDGVSEVSEDDIPSWIFD